MDQLKNIIKNLKNSQLDSEKFAYLLIFSKVVKPEIITDDEQEELCTAISSKFLLRLLNVSEMTPHSLQFKELAVSILKCCFLRTSYNQFIKDSINTLLTITQESNSRTLQEDVISILYYTKSNHIINKSQMLIRVLPFAKDACSSKFYEIWCILIVDLYTESEKNLVVELIEYLIDKLIQTSKPPSPSLEHTGLLVDSISKLISCDYHLHNHIRNFCSFKEVICNLSKTKLLLKDKIQLLNIFPFLTSIYSCSSWDGTMICYRQCCIELKLILEEAVHQHEENEAIHLSDIQLKCMVSCCSVLENAINELVDANNVISGENLQTLIDSIRMTIKSVMFYLQKQLFVQPCFIAVFRLFMRWASDDSFDFAETINTFRSLTKFFDSIDNYKRYGSFMTSAVINQMENAEFRQFMNKEYGTFLLEISLQNWKIDFVFAPIFNDLLTRNIIINIKNTIKTEESNTFTWCLTEMLNHEEKKFKFYNLSLIQIAVYIIIAAKRHNLNISNYMSLSDWLKNSINYVLKPLQLPEPPQLWCDLRDMWLSSVNSLCICLDKHNVSLDMDLDFLVSKSANYSETCDDVTSALEDLLAAIIK